MSADAKIWQDASGEWRAVHDGECTDPDEHHHISRDLAGALYAVEECMNNGHQMRWMLCSYPEGPGLSGYIA